MFICHHFFQVKGDKTYCASRDDNHLGNVIRCNLQAESSHWEELRDQFFCPKNKSWHFTTVHGGYPPDPNGDKNFTFNDFNEDEFYFSQRCSVHMLFNFHPNNTERLIIDFNITFIDNNDKRCSFKDEISTSSACPWDPEPQYFVCMKLKSWNYSAELVTTIGRLVNSEFSNCTYQVFGRFFVKDYCYIYAELTEPEQEFYPKYKLFKPTMNLLHSIVTYDYFLKENAGDGKCSYIYLQPIDKDSEDDKCSRIANGSKTFSIFNKYRTAVLCTVKDVVDNPTDGKYMKYINDWTQKETVG
uniref:Uncharacterized protein n=1 Tax=Panagrolaimus sp. JU765 TaxID=591449 RepID=A0AC34R2X1_9BILA